MQFHRVLIMLIAVLSMGNYNAIHGEQADQEQKELRQETHDALLRRFLKQSHSISRYLQELSESINAQTIHVTHKDNINSVILRIQRFITDMRNQKYFTFNSERLSTVLEINKMLIELVHRILQDNTNATLTFDIPTILRKSEKIRSFSEQNLLQFYNENERALHATIRKNRQFNISPLNRMSRNIDKIMHDNRLYTLTKRLAPYALLSLYLLYITPKTELPKFLHSSKTVIGGNPLKADIQMPLPDEMLDSYEKRIIEENKNSKVSQKYPKFTAEHGLLGTPIYYLRQVIDVDTRPLITIGISSYFLPILKKDALDIYHWSSEKLKQLGAYLKNELYEDPSPIKSSKITFSDIIGYDLAKQQLSAIIPYFKSKELFDRTGTHIDRGLLFVGPLDIGKLLAHGLAGEISQELTSQQSSSVCGIYEFDASLLFTKKIDDILKEIEDQVGLETPTIVLIENLNWLCTNKTVNATILSDLINAMQKNLRGFKKQIFIIATINDAKALDDALKGQNRLSSVIYFNNPNKRERKAYFTKELTQRGIQCDSDYYEKLALSTENCSFNMLEAIIKNACTSARAQNDSVTCEQLERAIDQLVHHIQPQTQYRNRDQEHMHAVHLAGQIMAYLTKQPRHKELVKATIFCVGTDQQTVKQGALITHTHDASAEAVTPADLKTECILLLSGIEAQKQLNPDGQPLISLLQETRTEAFSRAKRIVLNGDSECDLPKDMKQKKLTQAYELLDQLTLEAAALVKAHLHTVKELADALVSKK